MKRINFQRLGTYAIVAIVVSSAVKMYKMRNDPFSQLAAKDETMADAGDIEALAEEAIIYGFPLVMNYAVLYEHSVDRSSSDYKAPLNVVHSEARVYTPADKSIVTPNSDTPYSTVMMDLRAEPVVLSVPAVPTNRYFSVMLCDGNAFNYGFIGSRTTGTEAGDFMVVGPDWNGATPEGIKKVFRSGSQFSLALFRTQLFGKDDLPAVEKIQSGYKAQTVSAYLHKPPPPPAPALKFPPIRKAQFMQNFFEYLDFALQFSPPGPEETEIRAKLARVGIGSGKGFEFRKLLLKHKAEIAAGAAKATFKISKYSTARSLLVNGWMNCDFFGDRAFYDGDWLKRSAAVGGGIFGNDAAEAVYYRATELAGGEKLDGGKAAYTMTFAAGELPPVNAFWSVTMYNGHTFLLVDNPINRYLVNSEMLGSMKKNADGSLTIYIQKDSPGPDKESNWLPARDGVFMLVMRLYWPRQDVLDGRWLPPRIEKAK